MKAKACQMRLFAIVLFSACYGHCAVCAVPAHDAVPEQPKLETPVNTSILSIPSTSLVSIDHVVARGPGDPLGISVDQEAEAALDRARTWLLTQPAPTDTAVKTWVYNYAKATDPLVAVPLLESTSRLLRISLFPEVSCSDQVLIDLLTTFPKSFPKTDGVYRRLFALTERCFALKGRWPGGGTMPDWRKDFATYIVNNQQIKPPRAGYWIDTNNTAWAIMTLRALQNIPIPVTLIKDPKPCSISDSNTSTPSPCLTPSSEKRSPLPVVPTHTTKPSLR